MSQLLFWYGYIIRGMGEVSSATSLGLLIPEYMTNRQPTPSVLANLWLASLGLSSAEASSILGLSVSAVKKHRSEAIHTFGYINTRLAVREGFRRGFLTAEPDDVRNIPQLDQTKNQVLEYVSLGFTSPEISVMQKRPLESVKQTRKDLLRIALAENSAHLVRLIIVNGRVEIVEPAATRRKTIIAQTMGGMAMADTFRPETPQTS